MPRDEYREYLFDYSIQRTHEWVQAYFTVEHYRWIECSSRRQGGFWYFEFDEQVSWWYFLVGKQMGEEGIRNWDAENAKSTISY